MSAAQRLAMGLLLFAFAGLSPAQEFPSRPLRWITPAAAGGPPDLVARILAERLSARLGQPVVVENRPGVSGTIGLAEVLKLPADGHTLANIFMPVAIAQTLYPKRFDLVQDFAPVTQAVWQYNVLIVPGPVQARSAAELVALLKANPGSHSFASAGNGTPSHIAGELFKRRAGADALHVPYKAFPQAVIELLGGRSTYMFASMGPVVHHVQSGKLRALGIAATQRSPALPEVPTMTELGYPELEMRDWQGMLVRAGTPRAAVSRLNAELVQILAEPAVSERLRGIGADVVGGSPEQFGALVAAEVRRWGTLLKELDIRID